MLLVGFETLVVQDVLLDFALGDELALDQNFADAVDHEFDRLALLLAGVGSPVLDRLPAQVGLHALVHHQIVHGQRPGYGFDSVCKRLHLRLELLVGVRFKVVVLHDHHVRHFVLHHVEVIRPF